ncbi:hypothetical protein E4L95_06490 [Paracoccus liaowanqingii]|uniref:Uncharacterized protein n=1 Tax=Paracoccus liaowanqingii TaxID=2560053 RepID=A0A4Z1BXW0_9RHOB|nr:hypothetical protein [Paracoccus liaowanqingii]TGN62514.1 hypothetical protein E4L95_06490 [Paracoccus liaowanqingii]
MSQQINIAELRPFVSAKDLGMIISAIGLYSHRADYRDLQERLQHQAGVWGVSTPVRSIPNFPYDAKGNS